MEFTYGFRKVTPWLLAAMAFAFAMACGGEPEVVTKGHSPTTDAEPSSDLDHAEELPGEELVLRVEAGKATFVDLARAKVLNGDPEDSLDWDLAFRGWDVFTNSGPSGPGDGAGFGPTDELDYLFDGVPSVPFMRADTTGGAFLEWFDYDGENHALWSRYHLYGVHDGDRLWKVQLLSYYGEDFGAPVGALYRFRYAEVGAAGVGETTEVLNLDGTAGYPDVSEDTGSGCIDLASGERQSLTPRESLESSTWDLCFRRDAIRVNGEQGGPGGVTAVDLDASRTSEETLEDVKARTPESELARFEDLERDSLVDNTLNYRGDRVISIFGDAWFEGRGEAAEPARVSWLVRGADGEQQYLLVFREIRGSTEAAGEVTFRVRKVGQ
jgi:hypothetical protein